MLVAADVYKIAKALSKEEFIKLSDMLKSNLNKNKINLKNKNSLPDFTEEDALRFLLENLITK